MPLIVSLAASCLIMHNMQLLRNTWYKVVLRGEAITEVEVSSGGTYLVLNVHPWQVHSFKAPAPNCAGVHHPPAATVASTQLAQCSLSMSALHYEAHESEQASSTLETRTIPLPSACTSRHAQPLTTTLL